MQPQQRSFPAQGPPMRPFPQPGYSPGPRPGGYGGPPQMMAGGPQRVMPGMPGSHGGMAPHPYAGMRSGMSPGMPPPPGPPGMQTPMDRKRLPDPRTVHHMKAKQKKKKVADKILPQRVGTYSQIHVVLSGKFVCYNLIWK
ncbi:unnamed protein product [Mytilus coruscus]|uniref:SMARCD n=1 Tax=Mytilus coruscus TaxID=42192 RepID=A0A6J8BDW5_MYTCO|nr:unnamed protein product [Mytilus coruscus]